NPAGGDVYITGATQSSDFPTTYNAYDRSFNGDTDAFVTRFDFTPASSSTKLEYSTYLGGDGDENLGQHGRTYVGGIAVDNDGSAYVTGSTASSDFPDALGAYQGAVDAFVSKMSSDGKSLVYSTYLGGLRGDYGTDIAVDSSGNAYVTGFTAGDFPTTSGAFNEDFGGGSFDAFISKLAFDGGSLEYSTYLGGNADDYAAGIAVEDGYAYIVGETYSNNLPTTSDAFQESSSGGHKAFVSKLSADGSSLEYSTYLGGNTAGPSGSSGDAGTGIAVKDGYAYVTGVAYSSDFPTTTGAYQENIMGAFSAFVTKLNPDGSSLEYSTYLGGGWGNAIAVDSEDNAYVTGRTGSKTFPITGGVYHDENWRIGNTGGLEVFVTKMNTEGSDLEYSTVIGDSKIGVQVVNVGTGIAVDTEKNAYVTGYTRSKGIGFPVTSDAYQSSYGGSGVDTSPWAGGDAFLLRLNPDASTLDYSTFLGGEDFELTDGIALGQVQGESHYGVYITGRTSSRDVPTTPGAYDSSRGGNSDAFVSKFIFPANYVTTLPPEETLPSENEINEITEKVGKIQELRDVYRSLAYEGQGLKIRTMRSDLNNQIAGFIAKLQIDYSNFSADEISFLNQDRMR
ncbi:MAG: SBBP repeat-containing protein, partial [Candidatus Omnitrophota bacterium]